jgi:hypothetical protein
MRIGSSTNSRTCIATYHEFTPAGDSVFFYVHPNRRAFDVILNVGVLASLAYDFQARSRVGGLNLSEFVMNETATVSPLGVQSKADHIVQIISSLAIASPSWARTWMELRAAGDRSFWRRYGLLPAERIRLLATLEAIFAHTFAVTYDDYQKLLRDCDHPASVIRSDEFSRELDPKGFWRVDKEKDPELRHTVLAQVAFADLQARGLEAFLSQNNGEGWMLPETLRLADYGLGHDDRAEEAQPVASRLGPRFYDWQLEGTVEESWEECRRHADVIGRIRKG